MARILIIGGSLGGLLAANMLRMDGHDVCVLEKVRGSMDGRGAGIVTHDALTQGLKRAGLDETETLGVAIDRRVLLNHDGSLGISIDMPQVLTSWSRLYHLLHRLVPAERYLQGVSVEHVEQLDDRIVVHALDGEQRMTFEADLVIASDGIRSAVRLQYAPHVQPVYAGYVAWRGVCDEVVLSQLTLSSVFDTFGFCLPDGEQIIGYPVAGPGNNTRRGHRAYNFVWYRPAASGPALEALLTDADGIHHPGGISPNKVSWKNVSDMRLDARRLLAPQFAEMIEKTAQPFLQPIYDLASSQIAFDRVALMGDASFVGRPHIGMGVTKAAQDATALADAIRQHGANAAALRVYEHQRIPQGQMAVDRARWLGSYMQSRVHGLDAQTAERNAREVVAETAIDLSRFSHSSDISSKQPFRGQLA
jgi:2-polyprenyl-6-methoxyphenol hydroxylase-like FAD-dependent oxidoreductase